MNKEEFDELMSKDIDEIFGYEVTAEKLLNACRYIVSNFCKPKYSSIPRQYYSFLLKLLSYRRFDYRGKYKENEIKTFFVGKNGGTDNIMFYDCNNNCDSIGCVKAVDAWQKDKNNNWEYMKDCVLNTLRGIVKCRVSDIRKSIQLPVKCEITGEMLNDLKEIEIDHNDKDFSEVAYDFLKMCKMTYEKNNNKPIDIISHLYNLINENGDGFKTNSLNDAFLEYHDNNTHLRIVSAAANRRKKRTIINWHTLKKNGYYIELYEKKSN